MGRPLPLHYMQQYTITIMAVEIGTQPRPDSAAKRPIIGPSERTRPPHRQNPDRGQPRPLVAGHQLHQALRPATADQ